MRNKFILIVSATIFLLALAVGLWTGVPESVNAAPVAVVTDVSYIGAGGDGSVQLVDWMTKRRLTADTTVCKDLSLFKAADIEWVIDQTAINTVTIKLRDTVDRVNLVDEATMVTANVADVTGMNQFKLHAVNTCMFVDLTNANPIVITIVGKAMK